MNIIEIHHLKYRYPDTKELALDDISFHIKKGEFIGIAGGNGSGKSTLCYALSGLVPHFFKGAYGGQVFVDDIEVKQHEISDLIGKIGMVLDQPFSQMTGAADSVFEEIAFGLENIGIEREEMIARVKRSLDMLALTAVSHRFPFSLSGGQMQRTAIASMIAMKPAVLVLDEPTSQLDPQGTKDVFQVVARLAATGMTIVMATHDVHMLTQFADKILLLDHGKLVDFDVPATIFARDDLDVFGVDVPIVTAISRKHGQLPCSLQEITPEMAANWRKTTATKQDFINMFASEKTCHALAAQSTKFSVTGLQFAYDEVEVLSGINLSFGSESTAIIGQNGAGKTTLVKLLKGLLTPTAGDIHFEGKSLMSWTTAERAAKIGLVFQNPNDQIFKSTVLQEVMFGPLQIGQSKQQAQTAAIRALEQVGLVEAQEVNPYDLSLSARKLVTIASVLAMDTEIIIFDEPTMGQDAKGKQAIKKMIANLRKQRKLVLCILHDLQFASEVFERIIILQAGKVIADAAASEVFLNRDLLSKAGLQQPEIFQMADIIWKSRGAQS